MNGARAILRTAAFVPGALGPRLRLVTEPQDQELRGTVIAVHAFAEEMNKSRRMSARMARLLAGSGWQVVQTDLAGCGDSSGEFRDASWSAWVEDLRTELSSAAPQRPVWLWCLRAGALLAAPVLAERNDDVHLLLWQPVISGAQHLQQFQRLHLGAQIVGSAGTGKEQTARQRLQAGDTVELGGYELNPALAAALEQSSFDLPTGFAGRIVWFELSPDAPAELSPAASRAIERLRARGLHVDAQALKGPLFWQTQEIAESEVLLESSLAALNGTSAAPPGSAKAHAVADACHG